MTYEQLLHAIKAACDVSDDVELWVYGSQSILGTYPNPPSAITASIEVDVEPVNNPEAVVRIDGALGEGSTFHRTHGFYVHGVKMDGLVNLPEGWKYRTIAVEDPLSDGLKKGFCLEVHDLAASKISAFRPKDKDFVRTLIVEKLLDPTILMQRVQEMSFDERLKEAVFKWLEYTIENS